MMLSHDSSEIGVECGGGAVRLNCRAYRVYLSEGRACEGKREGGLLFNRRV